MLLSTPGVLTTDERAAALAAVPWVPELRGLVGQVNGALRKGAIDLIDGAIGEQNHARAAIVTAFEGLDALLQASMDLADSMACMHYFSRVPPLDPLSVAEEAVDGLTAERLRRRFGRLGIENAAVKIASGSDHLTNAYLRLAWEANAATEQELVDCGFDPAETEPKTWANVGSCLNGLTKARKGRLPLLPNFALTRAFEGHAQSTALRDARDLRDEVVHRERPAYREAVPYGRTTLWTQESFRVDLKAYDNLAADDPRYPSLEERRDQLGRAIRQCLKFGDAFWSLTCKWLLTVGVVVKHDEAARTVSVTVSVGGSGRRSRVPRSSRDPGPFLSVTHRGPRASGSRA